MTVILVDLSNLVHREYAVRGQDGDTNATATAVVAQVRRLASGQPHVAICCDSGKSFRHELAEDYKATRGERDPALYHQMARAIELLKADGFPVWAAKGFEADDLIATAATKAQAVIDDEGLPKYDVLIVSSDKDLTALVGPFVSMKRPDNGVVEDEEGVKARLGVPPSQVLDYLTLVGDASDNIKGAKGIGPKTAVSLLEKFGTLDELYTDLEATVGPEGLHTLVLVCDAPVTNPKTGGQKRCGKCAVCISQQPYLTDLQAKLGIVPSGAMSLAEFATRRAQVRALITLRTDVEMPFEEVFAPRVTKAAAEYNPEADYPAEDGVDDMQETAQTQDTPVIEGTIVTDSPTPTVTAPEDADKPTVAPVTVTPPKPAASQALVRTGEILQPWEVRLLPRDQRETGLIAQEIYQGGLFSAYGSPQAVKTIILAGAEMGMTPMASLRGWHIIEGKPSMSAATMAAVVMNSGKAEYFEPIEIGPESVTFETKRKGARNPIRVTHTIAMARQAWSKGKTEQEREESFLKSGWGRNPTDMLVARCQARLARYGYPDILNNVYTPDEVREEVA